MRILDVNGNEVQNPDLTLGYLKNDRIFVAHHDAVLPVKEEYHYETVKEYPNGGRDVKKVIDVEAVEGKDAWDEYEDIQRYTLYTPEEYEARNSQTSIPSSEERISVLENTVSELTNMIAGLMVTMASMTTPSTPEGTEESASASTESPEETTEAPAEDSAESE